MVKINRSYGLDRALTDVFPRPVIAARAPAATDKNHPIGRGWVRTSTNQSWILTSVVSGSATWSLASPGASDVDTINSLAPVGGDILIDGGTNLTESNAGHTVTLNMDAAITLATSVSSPIFTSTGAIDTNINAVAGQDILIKMGDAAAANKVSFVDSASAEVASIDSNGAFTTTGLTFTGLLTASASATINTAGTTLTLAADNSGDAVILGGGTVARAITIGQDAAAHTVTIGQAAAGAITIDTAAGISLDAVTASNFTVTGAADLTIASTAGSIPITAGQAVADAIVIEASDAGGGVQIKAGSTGVLIGNEADTAILDLGNFAPTATRLITIGGGTVVTAAVTDTVDIAPDGATTNADSIKTVNVNTGTVATGQLLTNIASGTVTSGTHTTSIATGNRAAGTMALDLMTGTGTKIASLGNADALTTLNIDATTLINDSINANTSINTGTSTGTVTVGNGAAGAITVDTAAGISLDAATASNFTVSAGILDIDSSGILSINSSAGVINVGDDAVSQNINVGTAGTRTVTVGSTTTTSALVLQSGTGEITVTGTVKEIDAEFLSRSGDDITFQASPIMQSALTTGAAPTGATGDVNVMMCQEGMVMEQFILGAGQTIIAPRMSANGLLVSLDLAATEGAEYNYGAALSNSRNAFTIGTSAAFFFEVGLYINDMDGADPYVIGFRKVEANNATFGNYTDYAAIGMIASTSAVNSVTVDELNATGQTITDTTDAWGGDGATNTLRVLVSAAGVVTYTINGAAATAAGAITFDNADVVVPFIRLTHSASATAVAWSTLKCGFQA